jgi:hypothetical protein
MDKLEYKYNENPTLFSWNYFMKDSLRSASQPIIFILLLNLKLPSGE